MNKLVLYSLFALLSFSAFSQKGYYSVKFTDKNCNGNLKPSQFLSQKSLERRKRSKVEINKEDFPLCADYLYQISTIEGIVIKNRLKWSNEITIAMENENLIQEIKNFSFVKSVEYICAFPIGNRSNTNKFETFESPFTPDYGKSKNQIEMIGMNQLHQKSFTGEGMLIAVFDAGFRRVDTMEHFQKLWKNKQIVGQRDYVNHKNNVFYGSNHGMSVLSTMAINIEGEMSGTAPNANYYLMLTEDSQSESLMEEYNWAEAAEYADSLGVDIINSSLGYTEFDDSTTNHTYADLDGNTTIITKAANKAFEKGILVVNSAGNSGNKEWHYIGAPADGYGVLSIGAVDSLEVIAPFSSRGPTAKGVIKPDVCALGSRVYVVNSKSKVDVSWGTSFSGPIIAGAAACLWQSHPEMSNNTLMEVIRKSAHIYSSPNNDYGYGIPNFGTALEIAHEAQQAEDELKDLINGFWLFPNPATDFIYVEVLVIDETTTATVEIYNSFGAQISQNDYVVRSGHNNLYINLTTFNAGSYMIRVNVGKNVSSKKFVITTYSK